MKMFRVQYEVACGYLFLMRGHKKKYIVYVANTQTDKAYILS